MTNTSQPIPYSVSKDHNVWYSQQSGREELLEGVNAFQMKYFFINFFHSKHIVKLFLSIVPQISCFGKKKQTNKQNTQSKANKKPLPCNSKNNLQKIEQFSLSLLPQITYMFNFSQVRMCTSLCSIL